MRSERIPIPRLREHQQRVADHPARFKVVRAGRRWGKDRLAFTVAIVGHGPERQYPGLLHGMDVAWIAPDYPQASLIWLEEVRPRFKAAASIEVNEAERWVMFPNGARLFVRSAEAIEGVRGVGKQLGGVVVNEAAHFDLEYAWRAVLRPALMDRRGWALIMSTTDGGHDGNALKVIPSYFNRLCQQIMVGERGPEWAHFYGTAHDNPTLPPGEIAALIAEYPPDSVALKQEVHAELIVGGGLLALPELNERKHFIAPFEVPAHWTRFGSLDHGFNHPYCFGDFAVTEDGDVFCLDTVRGRRHYPTQIAERIKAHVPVEKLRYIVAGHDAWADRKSIDEDVPTVAERLARHGIVLTQANISRIAGLNNLRDFLRWQGAGPEGQDWTPRLRFVDTAGNRWGFQQLQRMVTDPLDPEDALKVDADPRTGEGGDDFYDMLRYGMASRPPAAPSRVSEEPFNAWSQEALVNEAREQHRSKRHRGGRGPIPDAVF